MSKRQSTAPKLLACVNNWRNSRVRTSPAHRPLPHNPKAEAIYLTTRLNGTNMLRAISEVSMSFAGRTALITGGSRGIGRGIALKLAERGARIAITYVAHEDAAQQTVEAVKRHDTIGTAIYLDVGDRHQIDRGIDGVVQELGPIHIFVSNARTEIPTFYATPFSITAEQWNTAFD